jgi:hypothetical protein
VANVSERRCVRSPERGVVAAAVANVSERRCMRSPERGVVAAAGAFDRGAAGERIAIATLQIAEGVARGRRVLDEVWGARAILPRSGRAARHPTGT